MNTFDTFCPYCDVEVTARIVSAPGACEIRGEEVAFMETLAICPHCGEAIGDSRVEEANFQRAYDAYRAAHGIPTSGELKALRESYGLSLREFSRFLGFGEQTEYRYERGALPDAAHANTLALAATQDGARMLLDRNGGSISPKSRAKVSARIEAGTVFRKPNPYGPYDAPSVANGFRTFDAERASALAYELSLRCTGLYWTKMQKSAFFADMLCYKRCSRSLTGTRYAHATYGPVMDKRVDMIGVIANQGEVGFAEIGDGDVLYPIGSNGRIFDIQEMAVIEDVAEFVNTFSSSTELSDFSHTLDCWIGTRDGEIIPYGVDVEGVILARLGRG